MKRTIKSAVCYKFERRLNNEIATWEYLLVHKLINILKSEKITNNAKQAFSVPMSIDISMYDITQQAIEALPRMTFLYITLLIDAFIKEYLSERMSIPIESVEGTIKSRFSSSISLYDISYVNSIVDNLYGINLSGTISELTFEIGELRRCIVHNDARLDRDYRKKLGKTIDFLSRDSKVDDLMFITKKLMNVYIEDFRKIVTMYDY